MGLGSRFCGISLVCRNSQFLFDAHALGSELGGNERYVRGLLEGFEALGMEERITLAVAKDIHESAEVLLPAWRTLPYSSKSRLRRLFIDLPEMVSSQNFQLYHVTAVAPPFSNKSYVLTVHDILFEDFPDYFPPAQVLAFMASFRYSVARASHVITISNYTRDRLVDLYRLSPSSITVSHLGVGREFRPVGMPSIEAVREKYGIRGAYVLAVGNLHPRKNIRRLGEAFLRLAARKEFENLQLVLVGKKTWRADKVLQPLEQLMDQGKVLLTGYVPDEDLPGLYSGARVFVYPSLFEGFGIPPLEAMACGTPVIVGKTTSLPEVCGDAAHWVNPYDVDDIERALLAVLSCDSFREELAGLAKVQASRFSWEKTAAITMGAYAKAMVLPRI